MLEGLGSERPRVVEACAGLVPREAGEGGGRRSHETDPHFWLDPLSVVRYAENIRDALSELDPAGADAFRANAAAYAEQLRELDRWIAGEVSADPAERRLLVTNHESLGYFADRYGFRIVGTVIPSVSSGATPSAKELAALVGVLKQTGAPARVPRGGDGPPAGPAARRRGRRTARHRPPHPLAHRARGARADLPRDDARRRADDRRRAGSPVIDWLLAPLAYGFMQRGMLAGVIVGVLCAVIGCFVVLRSMAFIGDAMAHAVLPGVAVSYLLKGDLFVGALGAALAVALGIGALSRRGAVREDSAIGILFAAALSLGVLLISSIRTYAVDLSHILFGNVLGVSVRDLVLTAVDRRGRCWPRSCCCTRSSWSCRSIRCSPPRCVCPRSACAPPLLVLLALTIVVSLQTVGIGLVSALLVTPAATAHLLTRRLPRMMAIAAAIGVAVERRSGCTRATTSTWPRARRSS